MSEPGGQRVVIIGQGYVGLPVSMRAVEVGYDVVGFDVGKHKIDGLKNGESYIDDITGPDVAQALATGCFLPTSAEADLHG